eukprot:358109_1
MALTSDCIDDKIKLALTKIHFKDKLLVCGFIRNILVSIAPSEIVNYCIIFAFLRWNCWLKGGEHWVIEKYVAKLVTIRKSYEFKTIYADPVISKGKHEWKIKIIEQSTDIFVGISSANFTKLDWCFIGKNENSFIKNYTHMSYAFGGKICPSTKTRKIFKTGDIISVHLNMEDLTLGVSVNDTFLGNAFEKMEKASYRLAVSVSSGWMKNSTQIIEMIPSDA